MEGAKGEGVKERCASGVEKEQGKEDDDDERGSAFIILWSCFLPFKCRAPMFRTDRRAEMPGRPERVR